MKPNPRWLLVSDVHFKHHDLDRVVRTAEWIASLPHSFPISRAIICGDLLTTRTSQPTHVLSACYRFLGRLVDAVPRVELLLGNHDLAYRRDYAITALDALNIGRLAPYVSLHSEVSGLEWEGRRVLMLPFREEQAELVAAVHKLGEAEAAETVAFGHLAVHKAILQRHVVRPTEKQPLGVTTYRGLTGAGSFASLARTFTGHFHAHQTILQKGRAGLGDESERLQGSVTYLGSPLQLGWADLLDANRGAVLLDPATLRHELVVNPHAVGYVTAELADVLEENCTSEAVADRHVMLLGELSGHKYVTARDRLLDLGARSVRSWSPMAPTLKTEYQGIGMTVLPADAEALGGGDGGPAIGEGDDDGGGGGGDLPPPANPVDEGDGTRLPDLDIPSEIPQIDFTEIVKDYVSMLELPPSLGARRELLAQVGQRLIRASGHVADDSPPDDYTAVPYKRILDPAAHPPSSDALAETATAATSRHVFVAEPVSLTITNFLGVQNTLSIDFARKLHRGLTFIVGDNGSGKSTLVEAVVWAQYGRCIRSGLGVNDVVNDRAGRDCSVRLEFANGYAITRYRMHKEFGNRVVVEHHGAKQVHLEKPTGRTTQEAIDELLGVDYNTFVRTVVLGHESAASFLSSSPAQRRELIESLLGLEQLESYAGISGGMVRQVDARIDAGVAEVVALEHTRGHVEERVRDLTARGSRLRAKVAAAETALSQAETEKAGEETRRRERRRGLDASEESGGNDAGKDVRELLQDVEGRMPEVQREVDRLNGLTAYARVREAVDRRTGFVAQRMDMAKKQLAKLAKALDKQLEKQRAIAGAEDLAGGGEGSAERRREEAIERGGQTARKVRDWLRDRSSVVVPHLREEYGENADRLDTVVGALEMVKREASARHEARLRQTDDQAAAVAELRADVAGAEAELARLEREQEDTHRLVAADHGIGTDQVREALARLGAGEAREVPGLLSRAVKALGSLSASQTRYREELDRGVERRREREQRRQARADKEQQEDAVAEARWTVALDKLRSALVGNQQEAATYAGLLAAEKQRLAALEADVRRLRDRVSVVRSDREIFSFWHNAFSKRRNTAVTFRSFVLDQSLGELNGLFAQILTVLYDDTRHVRGMTSGMLSSLFAEGEESFSSSPPALDKSIRIAPGLGYAKRSGGERKRIDLALFFALLELGRARSAHRAGYVLVDEVFDSLDRAGQAGVARWCGWMADRGHRQGGGHRGRVLVITHSEHLVDLGMGEGDDEAAGVRMGVVRARMGEHGTELQWEQ